MKTNMNYLIINTPMMTSKHFKSRISIFAIALIGLFIFSWSDDEEPINSIPNIADQTFTIAENSISGTAVGTVVASDGDGDALNFSITAGNDARAFEVDESTGKLSVSLSDPLDYETIKAFSLTVSVSDGKTSTSATITINLSNVDDYNEFLFEGTIPTFVDGLITDYGSYDPFDESNGNGVETHYNYDFTILDIEFELITEEDGETYYDFNEDKFNGGLYVELFSPNGNAFEPGTFEYKNLDEDTADDLEGVPFFEYLIIGFKSESNEFVPYLAISGSVVVTENSELNYTLTFNVTVQQANDDEELIVGSKPIDVSFSYTGDFKYNDFSGNDFSHEDNSDNRRTAGIKKKKL